MASNIKYRHKITLEFNRDNHLYSFGPESITNLIIDYQYDNYNMPMMYVKISLEKEMIDWLIKNRENTYITINISKYDYKDSLKLSLPYIVDQFIYIMNENTNDIDDVDYNNTNQKSTNQRVVTIGLMKLKNIDDNKSVVNGIYNNNYVRDIILSNLTHMKLLMEMPINESKVNNLSIPIIDSTVKLLKEVNSEYNFYSTKYRYFIDYDKTYLLSSSGNGIPSIDEKYNKIVFDVSKVTSTSAYIEGMTTDEDSKSFLIHVNSTDVSLYDNKTYKTSVNSYTGIDKEGNVLKVDLQNNSTINTNSKTKIIRTNNLDNIKQLAQDTNNSIIVNILKSEIDPAIFTINKEFFIKNHSDDRVNGKYLLLSKKEVYVRKDDNFMDSCLFTLRKIV